MVTIKFSNLSEARVSISMMPGVRMLLIICFCRGFVSSLSRNRTFLRICSNGVSSVDVLVVAGGIFEAVVIVRGFGDRSSTGVVLSSGARNLFIVCGVFCTLRTL